MDLVPAPFHADLAEGPKGGHAVWAQTADGVRIRLAHFPVPEPRGTVLLFPGRTEYVEKYGRTAAHFAQRGYATLVIDWRGQGLADRLLPAQRTGHVHFFADYQKDVASMLAAAQALELPRPWHMVGHSMGGCIGLRAVMEGAPVASCAFTGPMWGINVNGVKRAAAWTLGWASARVGLDHVVAPGMSDSSYVVVQPFEDNLLTTDPEAYAHMRHQVTSQPDLQLGGPSLRWLHQSLLECQALFQRPSPDLPCLTYCGTNERIVDVTRIQDRMARWPRGKLTMVVGEHEVLMEGAASSTQVIELMVAHFDTAGAAQAAPAA